MLVKRGPSIDQAITLKPNTTYRIIGWIKGKGTIRVGIKENKRRGAQYAINVAGQEDWIRYRKVFTTGTETDVSIFMWTNGEAELDNLHLAEYP